MYTILALGPVMLTLVAVVCTLCSLPHLWYRIESAPIDRCPTEEEAEWLASLDSWDTVLAGLERPRIVSRKVRRPSVRPTATALLAACQARRPQLHLTM